MIEGSDFKEAVRANDCGVCFGSATACESLSLTAGRWVRPLCTSH